MELTINKYRLDYTLWTAYRAAQAGSAKAKGSEFTRALKQCGVIEYINNYRQEEITLSEYNKLQKGWCESIIRTIKSEFGKEIEYGIASKLIAVFLKGYYILNGNHESSLAKVIHPPIDSYLLKGIDAKKSTNLYKNYKWQKLNDITYFELIEKLQDVVDESDPLWKLEEYWVLS